VLPRMANRHGLVAGATGTGKTVTIHAMAERFSEIGVPSSWRTSRATWPASASPAAATPGSTPAPGARADHGLRADRLPGRLLGRLRRAGAPRPGHRDGDGPVLLLAAARASTTPRPASSRSPSATPTTRGCSCSTSRTSARCSRRSRPNAKALTTQYGNVSPPRSGRSSAACSGWRRRRRPPLRRAGPLADRPDPDRTRTAAGVINLLAGRQADRLADGLRDLPALAAVRAVRDAPRDRRPGQADDRLLLRRGPPALHRHAGRLQDDHRAGRPADPVEGGRGLLHQPEPLDVPRRSSASSATGSSTRCAPSPRATSGRSSRPAETFRVNPSSTSRPRSPSSASARR
jgi:hypothetical protein